MLIQIGPGEPCGVRGGDEQAVDDLLQPLRKLQDPGPGLAPPRRQPPHGPDQPEVADGVGDLGPPLRLEVREELEPAGVIRAVVCPAQRHHAVGVIAAAERSWCPDAPR